MLPFWFLLWFPSDKAGTRLSQFLHHFSAPFPPSLRGFLALLLGMAVGEKQLGLGSQIFMWVINDQVLCLESKYGSETVEV